MVKYILRLLQRIVFQRAACLRDILPDALVGRGHEMESLSQNLGCFAQLVRVPRRENDGHNFTFFFGGKGIESGENLQ